MRYQIISGIFILMVMSTLSCSRNVNPEQSQTNQSDQGKMVSGKKSNAGPPVYVYKTRNDYFDKVPVTLSKQKEKVVSFPGIKDVKTGGEYTYPIRLENGYLLDKRGIDENTAFLKLTYEEFSTLPETPDAENLYDMILDKDPFSELYYCGSRFDFKDLVPELNQIISENKLNTFERLK